MKNIKAIKEQERANLKAKLTGILKESKSKKGLNVINNDIEALRTQIEFEKEFSESK